jgi:hypothetical protein
LRINERDLEFFETNDSLACNFVELNDEFDDDNAIEGV